MNETKKSPSPPRLIPALVAGFDAITNHVGLLLFPIALDLVLWLAPHWRIRPLIEAYLGEMGRVIAGETGEIAEMFAASQEIWMAIAERFNLATALRAFPVGIPSLVSSILPTQTPLGAPSMLEVASLGSAVLLFLAFTVGGLIFGSLYFALVSQAATQSEIRWWQTLREWPRDSLQVLWLAGLWLILLLAVSVPAMCVLMFVGLLGISLAQLAVLLYGSFLIWMIFPLLFSPHGIFTKDLGAWKSIRHAIRITSLTLPTTALFFLAVFVLSQSLDLLWRVPPQDSWLLLIGIAGHAFVATGLLSASFIYYRDADRWIETTMKQLARTDTDTSDTDTSDTDTSDTDTSD